MENLIKIKEYYNYTTADNISDLKAIVFEIGIIKITHLHIHFIQNEIKTTIPFPVEYTQEPYVSAEDNDEQLNKRLLGLTWATKNSISVINQYGGITMLVIGY